MSMKLDKNHTPNSSLFLLFRFFAFCPNPICTISLYGIFYLLPFPLFIKCLLVFELLSIFFLHYSKYSKYLCIEYFLSFLHLSLMTENFRKFFCLIHTARQLTVNNLFANFSFHLTKSGLEQPKNRRC